jgi:glycosyltransferase involved in cell wall biosynthesis
MGWAGKLAQEQTLVMRPYQNLRKYFSRQVQVATAPSRFVLDIHQRMGFFPFAKKIVIPNTHGFAASSLQKNLELPSPNKKNLARRFLYLGRLDKVKGVDLLCEVFLRVAAGKQDFLLRIAGWGPLDESLREKYRDHNNIVFTGPVFGEQKAELFRDSDILVAPSVSPEPFGIVIAEAYSYGLPVITSRAGAFPEIVRDGETGFLVDTGFVDALQFTLAKVSEEPRLITAMSEACITEAQKYTAEKFIGNYLDIYEGRFDEENF